LSDHVDRILKALDGAILMHWEIEELQRAMMRRLGEPARVSLEMEHEGSNALEGMGVKLDTDAAYRKMATVVYQRMQAVKDREPKPEQARAGEGWGLHGTRNGALEQVPEHAGANHGPALHAPPR